MPTSSDNTDSTAELPLAEQPGVLVIRPPTGWRGLNLDELWRFRDLTYFLTWRELKIRYKQTFLGAGWAILQPTLMMLIFLLVFKRLANVDTGSAPVPLFFFAGLLPWTFFSQAVTRAANSFVVSERMITKVYFPRLTIPLSAVLAAGCDFLVAMGMMAVLMAWYGVVPGPTVWAWPLVVLLLLAISVGFGIFLAALNVTYRDTRHMVPFLMQAWMFATPAIYMKTESHTGLLGWVLALNPLSGLITFFRAATFGTELPWLSLAPAAVLTVVSVVVGVLYFRQVEDLFADII